MKVGHFAKIASLLMWPLIARAQINNYVINDNNGRAYATVVSLAKPDAKTYLMLGINIITILIFFLGLFLTIYGISKYLSARGKKDKILMGSTTKTIAMGILLMVIIFGLYALASITGQEDTADFWSEAAQRR